MAVLKIEIVFQLPLDLHSLQSSYLPTESKGRQIS